MYHLYLQSPFFLHSSHDYQNQIPEICMFHHPIMDTHLLRLSQHKSFLSNASIWLINPILYTNNICNPYNLCVYLISYGNYLTRNYHTADNMPPLRFYLHFFSHIHLFFPKRMRKRALPSCL